MINDKNEYINRRNFIMNRLLNGETKKSKLPILIFLILIICIIILSFLLYKKYK